MNLEVTTVVLGLSALTASIATLPWIFSSERKNVVNIVGVFSICSLLSMILYYFLIPSLAGPLMGGFATITVFMLLISGAIGLTLGTSVPMSGFVVALVVHLFVSISSCALFRAREYAALVGEIEVRDWKDDIQPKDPRHFRTSSPENAEFMATRAIGQATAITNGAQQQQSMSQFDLIQDSSSIQIIRDELWTIVPLDWKDLGTWTSNTPGIPGYVKVHGEDPVYPAKYVSMPAGQAMRYTPGAFWGQNLERLVWHAQPYYVIADIHLEIDDGEDGGKPHYVVSLAVPTIGWSGLKVVGSLVVNPVDGSGVDKFYPLGKEPGWVDRVMAPHIVHDNIDYHGKYASGFWNRSVTQQNLNVATETHFGFGGDGAPVLATGIASRAASGSDKHDSLIGVYYTNTRDGKTVEYRVPGGATEATCITQVNQIGEVRRDGLHGTTPQLYNLYGHLVYVVPTQNASHAFQGVAICDIMNVQVTAWAKTAHNAALDFKQRITGSGTQIAIDGTTKHDKITGKVIRVGWDMINGEKIYTFLIEGTNHLFTGSVRTDETISVTQLGDVVTIDFINSGEKIMPIYSFSNTSVPLETTKLHEEVEVRAQARQDSERNPNEEQQAQKVLDKLSPAERAAIEKLVSKK